MRKIRAGLITALLFIFAIWSVWQVIQPMIPYLIVGVVLSGIISLVVYRRR